MLLYFFSQAYVDPEIEAVQVSVADVLTFASFYVSLNVGTLAVWNLVSPLEWTRVIDITRDTFDRPLESYGLCDSNGATAFIAAMVCLNVGFLSVGTYWAYRIRNVATEHNESRYIGMVIAAILQAWLMAGPILIALHRYPSYTFFVKTGVIVTTSGVGVGLVFCPKIYAIYKESKDPLEPNSHFLESTEQPRCEMAPSAASNFFYSNSQDYPESINIMHSRKVSTLAREGALLANIKSLASIKYVF